MRGRSYAHQSAPGFEWCGRYLPADALVSYELVSLVAPVGIILTSLSQCWFQISAMQDIWIGMIYNYIMAQLWPNHVYKHYYLHDPFLNVYVVWLTMSSFANYTDITRCPNSTLIPVDLSLEPPVTMLYGGAEKVLVTYILPFIVVFGLLSNSAFIFVLLRVRQMRNATNCYLANLAVCDTLYILAAGGEKILQYLYSPVNGNNIHLGRHGCAAVHSIIYVSYFVSFVVVTLVSLERFYAVKYPLHHRSVTRRKRTFLQVGCSWIVGGILSGLYVPAFAELKQYCIIWPEGERFKSFPDVIGICGSSKEWQSHLGLAIIFSSYMISLVCNIYLYGRIIASLHQRTVTEEQSTLQSNYTHVLQVRNQVARMLIANGVIFFVCQTPYRILSFFGNVLHEVIRDAIWYHPAVRISHMLLYLNAAINAVVYTVGSECYRSAFREAFTGKPSKQPGEPTPIPIHALNKRPSGTSTVI